jgi:oxygen-independent coproporphyrinogen-3 oxidase
MTDIGLYVHVPFCKKRCVYCDFDSSVPGDGSEIERYLAAVKTEADAAAVVSADERIRTVYVGGGTPTVIGAPALIALIDSFCSSFKLGTVSEFTCEANPESATAEVLKALLRAGVNRLSLGVQSFDDALLRWMGRLHTSAKAEAAFARIRDAGFENVSVDLIYGLPGQTFDGWSADVSKTIELGPEHVSAYCLQLGPEAPITKKHGAVELPDDGLVADMYYAAKDMFETAGYRHYEISNFAKPGYECVHNVNYWNDGTYIGLGPSAASHVGGARYANPRGLDAYVKAVGVGGWPLATPEPSDVERESRTAFVLGLRMLDGVKIGDFESRHGKDINKELRDVIYTLTDAGLLKPDGETVRLTRHGLFLSDEVFSRLI